MAHPRYTPLQRSLSRTFRIPVRQHHLSLYPISGRWVLRMVVVRRTGICPGWWVTYHPATRRLMFHPSGHSAPCRQYRPAKILLRSRNNLAFFSRSMATTVARQLHFTPPDNDSPIRLRFVGLPRLRTNGTVAWTLNLQPTIDIFSVPTKDMLITNEI